MRIWYLSQRRPAKAQASLCIRAVSPESSLFAHMKYGSRWRVRPKLRHLAPLDGCAFAFENWVYGGQKYHNLMRWLILLHHTSAYRRTADSETHKQNNTTHPQAMHHLFHARSDQSAVWQHTQHEAYNKKRRTKEHDAKQSYRRMHL